MMENYLSGKGNSAESRHSTLSLLQEAHCTTPQAQLLGHQRDDTLWELWRSVPALEGERTVRRKQGAAFHALLLAWEEAKASYSDLHLTAHSFTVSTGPKLLFNLRSVSNKANTEGWP